jgi:hypothetical protein
VCDSQIYMNRRREQQISYEKKNMFHFEKKNKANTMKLTKSVFDKSVLPIKSISYSHFSLTLGICILGKAWNRNRDVRECSESEAFDKNRLTDWATRIENLIRELNWKLTKTGD